MSGGRHWPLASTHVIIKGKMRKDTGWLCPRFLIAFLNVSIKSAMERIVHNPRRKWLRLRKHVSHSYSTNIFNKVVWELGYPQRAHTHTQLLGLACISRLLKPTRPFLSTTKYKRSKPEPDDSSLQKVSHESHTVPQPCAPKNHQHCKCRAERARFTRPELR